ncbi:MAG: TolC family protein [Candidatus Glassbacteria bacterium]
MTRSEAVRIALAANPSLEISRQQWQIMKALAVQRLTLPEPELEVEYEELPSGIIPGAYGQRNVGVNQRLELPHKWYLQKKSAGERATAVEWSVFRAKRNEITAAVKLAYDRLLLRKMILEHEKGNLELAEEIFRKASLRFQAGDVAQLEVLRAEVELARAEATMTDSENELDVTTAELNTLLARDIHEPIEMTEELEYQYIEIDPETLKDSALMYRPELKGARAGLVAARNDKILASTSFLTDVNIGIFRQRIRAGAFSDDYWRAKISFELPFWAPFSLRGRIMEKSSELRRDEAALEEAERAVFLEIERSVHALNSAFKQVELYRDRIVHEAEQAYGFAAKSYEEGKASYLELLEARKTLTDSRIEYSQKLYDYRAAMTRLELASGYPLFENN